MRLALFSPMPPVRSGIADYTRDLVAALTGDTEIDVFVATADEVDAARETGRRLDTPRRTTSPGVTTARRTT